VLLAPQKQFARNATSSRGVQEMFARCMGGATQARLDQCSQAGNVGQQAEWEAKPTCNAAIMLIPEDNSCSWHRGGSNSQGMQVRGAQERHL
jgi:hypothetical protein